MSHKRRVSRSDFFQRKKSFFYDQKRSAYSSIKNDSQMQNSIDFVFISLNISSKHEIKKINEMKPASHKKRKNSSYNPFRTF